MRFPFFSKRKADTVSKGVFLVLLGLLFYTGQWWPGILFVLGMTFALKQYLIGKRVEFLISLVGLIGLAFFTLISQIFPVLFPLFFIGIGIYLIMKECYPTQTKALWHQFFHSNPFKE